MDEKKRNEEKREKKVRLSCFTYFLLWGVAQLEKGWYFFPDKLWPSMGCYHRAAIPG
jgi:hypothetical protein